jgi:hypothetical protein
MASSLGQDDRLTSWSVGATFASASTFKMSKTSFT